MNKKIFSILIVLISIIISLGVVEVVLRNSNLVTKVKSGWGWRDMPFQKSLALEGEVNQLGLRGKRIDYSSKDIVVLLVGDSQVESASLSFTDMPENILERLNDGRDRAIKVFSIGASGWGQDQQYLALQKYFEKYRADYVFLWLTPANDIWENIFPDRSTSLTAGPIKPTFKVVDGRLKGPYFAKDFYYGGFALTQLLAERIYGVRSSQLIANQWSDQFKNINQIAYSDACMEGVPVEQSFFFQNIFDFGKARNLVIETSEMINVGRSHLAFLMEPKIQSELYGEDLTKKLISSIKSLSEKNSAKFSIFFPHREEDSYMEKICAVLTKDDKRFTLGGTVNQLVKRLSSESNLIYGDIEGLNENVISIDDRHLNKIGNLKAMQLLTDNAGFSK
jgi:hypothetical protein